MQQKRHIQEWQLQLQQQQLKKKKKKKRKRNPKLTNKQKHLWSKKKGGNSSEI